MYKQVWGEGLLGRVWNISPPLRSVNEVICHGIPDARELKDGDICNGK